MANFLQVQMKQAGKYLDKSGYRSVTWQTRIITLDTDLIEPNILQYEFYNYGDSKVEINGFLLREGALLPVSIPWDNKWIPEMQDKEIDRTVYRIRFYK